MIMMLNFFAHCRAMFGNTRYKPTANKQGEINYRQEEKKILDSVLGPDVYDKRIRPSGLNSTGNKYKIVSNSNISLSFSLR